MSFYENKTLPYVLDIACSQKFIMDLRKKIVPLAEGKVLEVALVQESI